MVCGQKLILDGYCDFEEYIYGRLAKQELLKALSDARSPYVSLYQGPYPNDENALALWSSTVKKVPNINAALSLLEARAIVNWAFRALKNADERIELTKQLAEVLSEQPEFHKKVLFAGGVLYIQGLVELNFISSLDKLYSAIADMQKPGFTLFFRGHADVNYRLLPSIMRSPGWQEHEKDMYNQLLINCSHDFKSCRSHLDFLVEMQHYGLPTRLLDITRNPLVALYFACASEESQTGELIVFSVPTEQIKYPQSDAVSVLASLPLFTYEQQKYFLKCVCNKKLDLDAFNKEVDRLLHEVRSEKPAFRPQINQGDLINCFVVLSKKNNARIMKQDGAFIICGLPELIHEKINQLRYTEKIGRHLVRQIYLIKNKSKLRKQLDRFSVNQASLFPEIDDVASYIKSQY